MSYVAGEYILQNDDKVQRAKEAILKEYGPDYEVTDELIRAYYDRLGGLIVHNRRKLEIGCFWDVVGKKVKEQPELAYVDGIVFVKDEEGELEQEIEKPPKKIKLSEKKETKQRKSKKNEDLQKGEEEEVIEVADKKVGDE